MHQCHIGATAIAILLLLSSCEVRYTSSVPASPVQVDINTKEAFFVHFIPENIGAWLIVNEEGYLLNGKNKLGGRVENYYGYAGLVIVVNCYNKYSAYDLCCPHCLKRNAPITVKDGSSATCPTCGETYSLSFGLGDPAKGISKEPLRRYNTVYSGDHLSVRP